MKLLTVLSVSGTADFARKGADGNGITIRAYEPRGTIQFKGLEGCISKVNQTYKFFAGFIGGPSLPLRTCRCVARGALGVLPGDNLLKLFREKLGHILSDRKFNPPAYLTAEPADNHNYMVGLQIPQDTHRRIIPLFWYELTLVVTFGAGVGIVADAQKTINVMYETTGTFFSVPLIRNFCLERLPRICSSFDLPPTPIQTEVPDTSDSDRVSRSGFSSVFKCEHQGSEVAVKVLDQLPEWNLQTLTHKFYNEAIIWGLLYHPNILPLLGVSEGGSRPKAALVSVWMKNRDISLFVRGRQDVNRFKLLADVARGLCYMHDHGVIHGDLKGANVLIDDDCNARIGDFGLCTTLDPTPRLSRASAGSQRWQSPEVLEPGEFDLAHILHTKSSDCFSFGMTIYEVLSGHIPFHDLRNDDLVGAKILAGIRPERPQGVEGVWFTDTVWEILERCWKQQPADRPDVSDALECFERVSMLWTPDSFPVVDPPQDVESPESTYP